MILTRTLLVVLSVANVQIALLCLPRFWAPQSVVLTTGPSHMESMLARQAKFSHALVAPRVGVKDSHSSV